MGFGYYWFANGKSTLFNALTGPIKLRRRIIHLLLLNLTGRVAVPDERLKILGEIGKAKNNSSYMDFVDIAGLVQGASKGEDYVINF